MGWIIQYLKGCFNQGAQQAEDLKKKQKEKLKKFRKKE